VKKVCSASISTSATSSATTAPVATKAAGLRSVSRLMTLRVSCRTPSRLNVWKNTKVAKAIVPDTVATPSAAAGPGAQTRTADVPVAMTALLSRIRSSRARVRIGSRGPRGGLFIASRLTGSTPSDIAGGPSMTRLTNRICRAVNGTPPAIPVTEATRKVSTKPRAVDSWKRVNFTMLS
jgi:hypothetical protein